MKTKHLLSGLLLFLSLSQFAQNGLNNLSFETWTNTVPFGPCPVGFFGVNTSVQNTGAQMGNSYVRITNTAMNQGGLMLGAVSFTGASKGGVPYTQNPVSLNGFFKTSGMLVSDTVGITAMTSKSGSIQAFASFTQTGNAATWTSFSVPFMNLNMPGPVDTLFMFAFTQNPRTGAFNSLGLNFDLDNLSLVTTITTGIDQRSVGTSFLVYPNPASNELNIYSKDENAKSVLITGMDGKIIGEIRMETETTKIDLLNYETGLYFYSVLNEEGAVLLTNKFVVSR